MSTKISTCIVSILFAMSEHVQTRTASGQNISTLEVSLPIKKMQLQQDQHLDTGVQERKDKGELARRDNEVFGRGRVP